MYLQESEIRKLIRKRLLLQEKAAEYEQSGGEIAGDVAIAGAAGVTGAYTAAIVAGAATATSAVGAQAAGAALAASGPPGWAIGAGVALALGIGYILLDEGDVGGDIEAILNGSWAGKTNTELKKVEEETKAKLKEAGMEDQLANFPSLTHYNDVMKQ
jgi:hypothetical protein